jgi:peroxiredoxin Q/BCP
MPAILYRNIRAVRRQPPASKFRKFCKAIRMKCAFAACSLLLIISSIACGQSARHHTLTVGDTIPAFTLPDQDGKLFNSADHLGKSDLVIFFYPKDESMVCTKEACSFRDRYADLIKAGAIVIGINGGSVSSHKAFQTHDNLPYPLLSDSANNVLNEFGVPRQFFMTGRKTFIVDKTGRIVFTYTSAINGTRHAEEALTYLQNHPNR